MRVLTTIFALFICLDALCEVGKFRLSWRDNPATTMVIGWDQVSGKSPVLYYSTNDHGQDISKYEKQQQPDRVLEYKEMHNHYVRLTGLKPDTAYYFVIKDSKDISKRYWFKTAPAQKKAFTFIAGGDSRNNPVDRTKGNVLVSKLRPLFILFGGDYTGSGKTKEWQRWLDDWQATISSDGQMYPIIATHGNHEDKDMTQVEKLFDVPNVDCYFKMNFADSLLEVFTLNSQLKKKKFSQQNQWINQALPQSKAKWKLCAYHKPMRPHTLWKSEGNLMYDSYAELFYKNKVDLVVESDTHMVKRTYPLKPDKGPGNYMDFVRDDQNGTVYIGEGSWGAPKRPTDDDKPWTMASGSFFQFKWITVKPEEILIRSVIFDNVDGVKESTPNDAFKTPEGLTIWQAPTGSTLRLPFSTDHPTYQHPPKDFTLLGAGMHWRFAAAGSKTPVGWQQNDFNENNRGKKWGLGTTPLGFGKKFITSKLPQASTYCFRRTFACARKLQKATLNMRIEDGAVIFINGQEAARFNMPEKSDLQTPALKDLNSSEDLWQKIAIDHKLLKVGLNTIAVEIHQAQNATGGLIFDLQLQCTAE